MGRKQRYVAPTPKYNYVHYYFWCMSAVVATVLTTAIVYHFFQDPVKPESKMFIFVVRFKKNHLCRETSHTRALLQDPRH